VMWIENTVAEAQDRYLDLASHSTELGVACGLIHSRFTVEDRQRIEDHWVNLFGKPGWPKRREKGRILVGTQVLEQSLDIDADFLVTRFCPTDMLLQRIGRLWRHPGTPRHSTATREVWVLAPGLEEAVARPITCFGNTAWVYSPYVLCRSLEVWQGCTLLTLPADIRQFIEATYNTREESGKMADWFHELEHGNRYRLGRKALRQLARITLSKGGTTLPESKAQTRYSEEDLTEVLLLQAMVLDAENRTTCITLLNGEQLQLPWDRIKLSKTQWRRLSARLTGEMVNVRYHHAPLPLPLDTLQKHGLHHCFYLGNPEQSEALLRLALVDKAEGLHGLHGAPLNDNYILQYRDDIGYLVNNKEEE